MIRRTALTAVFLAGIGGVACLSLDLGEQARLVPQIVLVPTLILLLLQLVIDLSPGLDSLDRALRLRVSAMPTPEKRDNDRPLRSVGYDLAWFSAAPASMLLIGLVPGGSAYAMSYLVWRARVRPARATIYTIATIVVLATVSELLSLRIAYRGYLLELLAELI